MTLIEDSCHTHVSHKWLYHLDACAGSVLTPYDYVTNVQKETQQQGPTQALSIAVCVDDSSYLRTAKSAAPLKPPEDTTLAFTPF